MKWRISTLDTAQQQHCRCFVFAIIMESKSSLVKCAAEGGTQTQANWETTLSNARFVDDATRNERWRKNPHDIFIELSRVCACATISLPCNEVNGRLIFIQQYHCVFPLPCIQNFAGSNEKFLEIKCGSYYTN